MILAGDLMTTAQAAKYCGVQQVTIRQWEHRGYLSRLNKGENPPLYLRTALSRCEEARQDTRRGTLKPTVP